MKKENLLFVMSETENCKNFLEQFLDYLDYEKYNVDILCLKGEYLPKKEKVIVRNLENSYLDTGFWQGIKKSLLNKKWIYIPILIKEKRFKKQATEDRIKYVKFEGKYKACMCLDLESSAYVANNVFAKSKILRFPFGGVEEPFKEDFDACKKFSWFVCLEENVKEPFANTYKINSERIKIIPPVPNLKSFLEKTEEYKPQRDTKFVFTSFCLLASLSQIDFVINVSKELIKANFTDFKWNVLSGTNDTVSTKIKINKTGLGDKINFIEKQENPYPYLKACDIYCQVSQIDGEFMSVEQAGYLGKPTLAIKTPKSEKHIKSGKTLGISSENPVEFAKKLIYMTLNPNEFLPEKPKYNTEKIMAEYELLFERPKKEDIIETIKTDNNNSNEQNETPVTD